MPSLIKVEGTTTPTPEKPTKIKKSAEKKTANALGGMRFRDDTAATPEDQQAEFLRKLLKQYPDATQPKIDPSLDSLIVNVEDLELDPDNAVLHPEINMRAIMESLAAFGQRTPITVRAENMRVMVGNGRLMAFKRLGWTKIAAAIQSMTDAEAAAYGLADNRTSDLHKWDKSKVMLLDKFIQEANEAKVRIVGWTSSELQAIRKFIPPDVSPQLTADMNYKIVIKCNDEQHQIDLLKEFQERNIECQALIS